MDAMEFVRAFGRARTIMEVPEMPAMAMVSLRRQCEFLSDHIVAGHFSPNSVVRIHVVKKGGLPLCLAKEFCDMVALSGDEGYRSWNLGNVIEPLIPGDELHWRMEADDGCFCIGVVKIGGDRANAL